MTAVTYYDPVLPGQEPILEGWERSWSRHGWATEVLTPTEARLHPAFQAYQKAIRSYPTVNEPRYEEACWMRWLAYSVFAVSAGPVLATDYDVINRALREGDIPADRLLALHQVPVAACVGTRRGFDWFIMQALERAEQGIIRVGGRMHVSDMTLAMALAPAWEFELACEEWWPDSQMPLVHVSAAAVDRHGTDKPTVIASLLE